MADGAVADVEDAASEAGSVVADVAGVASCAGVATDAVGAGSCAGVAADVVVVGVESFAGVVAVEAASLLPPPPQPARARDRVRAAIGRTNSLVCFMVYSEIRLGNGLPARTACSGTAAYLNARFRSGRRMCNGKFCAGNQC